MCAERDEMYKGKFKQMCEIYDGFFELCYGNQSDHVTGDYGHDIANAGGMFSIQGNCYKYDMHSQDMEKFVDHMIEIL